MVPGAKFRRDEIKKEKKKKKRKETIKLIITSRYDISRINSNIDQLHKLNDTN